MVVFFPMVPLPSAVELSYVDGGRERLVRIGKEALSQVHPGAPEVVRRQVPDFPPEAARQLIDKGQVKARLFIDGQGDVNGVQIVEASSAVFIKEAKFTFLEYKFAAGSDRCVVQEIMQFKQGESR